MNTIINLTQHRATPEQYEAGLQEFPAPGVKELLTFDELPTPEVMDYRLAILQQTALRQCEEARTAKVLIGGAPWLMGPLENVLLAAGLEPVYAFSRRVCEEVNLPDGTVQKNYVFKHEGFFNAF